MLLRATARRRPSLSSSRVAKRRSARAFAMTMRPSVSVSRIGSVTAVEDALEKVPVPAKAPLGLEAR